MAKLLLLISERPDHATFATEAAISAGLSLRQVPNSSQGAAIIANDDSPVIVMLDASTEALYQAFENAIQESIGLFSEKVNSNNIHFLSGQEIENSPYLTQSPLFSHFIYSRFKDPKECGTYYGHLVKATLLERAWGLKQLLKPGTKVQTVKLTSSSQKIEAVEAVKGFLIAARFQARMATVIANAVDELLLNAMFDAPSDDLGKPTLARTPRSTVLELKEKTQVELNIGFDGLHVGIMAVDLFGSLDKTRLLSHISKVYENEEYKPKTSVAGAGLGLATVFQSGGSFFFASESRIRTEVTVFFRRCDNFRDFKDQFRFICTQFYF